MTPEFQERCREYGLARIAVANECRSAEDWRTKWPDTRHPFAFQWGDCFKAAIELKVADFPAEVGFFIDVLGFDVNAFQSNYAMLITPEKDYTFSLVATKPGEAPVDPAAVTLEFMVREIDRLCAQLAERGITFQSCLRAEWGEANPMRTSELRTPNGLRIKLWGYAGTAAA